MAYPNTFEEFCEELKEDNNDRTHVDIYSVVSEMAKLLKSLKEDEKRGLRTLEEVLGLVNVLGLKGTDYIEAAFRTLLLDMFPGPSYKPAQPFASDKRAIRTSGRDNDDIDP